MNYIGGTCLLTVKVGKESADFNLVEPVFLDVLQLVNEKPVSDYLQRNPKRKSGSWSNLSIMFYNSKEKSTYYTFDSSQDSADWFKDGNEKNQIWKVENPSKEYRYSDYMK